MTVTKTVNNASFNNLLKLLPKIDLVQGPFVAGGAARRLWYDQDWTVADVDVFFTSNDQRLAWTKQFEKQRSSNQKDRTLGCFDDLVVSKHSEAYLTVSSANADTYTMTFLNVSVKLQLIKVRYCDTVEQLFEDFDFAASCFATDGSSACALPQALQSVTNKQLIPHNLNQNKNLALRLLKYHIYGFEPSHQLLKAASAQIANGEVDWHTNY